MSADRRIIQDGRRCRGSARPSGAGTALARIALVLAACGAVVVAAAQGRYTERDEFLRETFGASIPEPRSLWITTELEGSIEALLGHPFEPLRVRYWRHADTTAWILEEVGKERPITFGVAIENGEIARLSVLEFRETRGSEIRFPFFTDQFDGARLDGARMDRDIDGITGATLSVEAARRVAQLALFLHAQVRDDS